jgi:hypothetical protein
VPGGGAPIAAFEAAVLVALAVIGAVVASRRARNPVGWILCVIPVALGVLVLGAHAYWALALARSEDDGTAVFVAWLSSWVWIVGIVPAITLFPLLFPTGRPPTPRWRRVAWMALTAAALLSVGEALGPGRFEDYPVDNPYALGGALGTAAEVMGAAGGILMVLTMFAAAASLVVRFRRSRADERQQLKWVMAACVLFVAIFVFPTDYVLGEDAGFASLLLGLLAVAAAVAVAMLRHRLYDVDVVINRALVYGGLSAVLAGAYAGSVLLLQLVLSPSSDLAVAVSTLAVAALFTPARSRIQRGVDRRFYRSRYDARQTLARFAARMRDEVSLDRLGLETCDVVRDTMRPAHVSLWLREQDPGRG